MSGSGLVRSIAAGWCDHLPVSLFYNLLRLEELERHIDAQRRLQEMIMAHHFLLQR